MSRARLNQLVHDFSEHPGLAPLSQAVLHLAQQAWSTQDVVYPRPGSETLRTAPQLPQEATFGDQDLSVILTTGATTFEHQDLLAALTLVGFANAWPSEEDPNWRQPCSELTRCLLWLESFSGLHCLFSSSTVFDERRLKQLGEALLEVLTAGDLTLTEQCIAKAWLTSCAAPECSDIAAKARNVASRSLLAEPGSASPRTNQAVQGQLGPQPRSSFGLAVMALSGVLFLSRLGTAVGRLVLLRRNPTTAWISERGLELDIRYEMLGRRLRERRVLLPIDTIRTVEREIRFPRFGLYAGLTALSLGTLLGSRLFIDGLRVAGLSFPLMAMGLALVILGILLDVAMSGTGESLRGRCRIVITTHRGRGWAIGDLEPQRVDYLLTELSNRLSAQRA